MVPGRKVQIMATGNVIKPKRKWHFTQCKAAEDSLCKFKQAHAAWLQLKASRKGLRTSSSIERSGSSSIDTGIITQMNCSLRPGLGPRGTGNWLRSGRPLGRSSCSIKMPVGRTLCSDLPHRQEQQRQPARKQRHQMRHSEKQTAEQMIPTLSFLLSCGCCQDWLSPGCLGCCCSALK